MRFKKVNWKLRDRELIHNIIEVLKHYKKRLNVNDKNYCWNCKRRFKIERYYNTLLEDLKLQVSCYKFFKNKKGLIK